MMVLRAIGYTIALVLIVIAMIATLYVSMWIIFGVAVILFFSATLSMLKAKKSLS